MRPRRLTSGGGTREEPVFSVIFEVHPGDGQHDAYLGYAKMLKPELEAVEGFIDNERFASRSRPGWILSHSTWRDEKSVVRWRTHAGHHLIQKQGRFEVFSDYHLRVGEVTSDSHPPAGHTVRDQRLDSTEVGRSKLCTLTELVPHDGCELPRDDEALLGMIYLDRHREGPDEVEIYSSIYEPGKLLVLGSWAKPGDAEPFRSSAQPDCKTVRYRAIRIIRDYGMFDRRETPQYYPEVSRQS